MLVDRRIMLFAHPRSGSSSLYQILQLHPQLNIVEEPFNTGFTQWNATSPDYLSQVHDTASLDAVLKDIFKTFNGLKVLDYQLSDELRAHLLRRTDLTMLFLRRRNILQAVVSVLIATQTNLWKKWEMRQPLEDYYRDLQPLDVEDVRHRVACLKQSLDTCEAIIDARKNGVVLKFVYEDMYFARPEQRTAQIDAIWRALEVPSLEPAIYQRFLRPEEAKINGASTYAMLPNAEEIDQACGNNETGWLFMRDSRILRSNEQG